MPLFEGFFQGRRILITGHTGFKGSWLSLWLKRLGADITGISVEPTTEPSLASLLGIESLCEHHICDIRDPVALSALVQKAKPEIVFHLAAQPLVRVSYRQPLDTFSTNIMGTANLLEALRKGDTVKSVVMVTTDKVYQNKEWLYPYREHDRLGGYDPYSASKAASELVIESYKAAFLADNGVAIATARAGNVIGGGDWSEERLIPDVVRAWENQQAIEIRSPEATRPWQHVLEPLFGYMQLAKSLYIKPDLAGAFNFGPNANDAATVREVIDIARQVYGSGEVNYHQTEDGFHEAGLLMLDTSKSIKLLKNHPVWSLNQTIQKTFDWYRAENQGSSALALCSADIEAYEALL